MWVPTWSPWEVVFRASVIYGVVQILFRNIGGKERSRYAIPDLALMLLIAVAARQAIVGPDTSLTSATLLSELSQPSIRKARRGPGVPIDP